MKSFVFGLLVLCFTDSLARFALSPEKKRQNACDEMQFVQCILPIVEFSNTFSGNKLEALSDAANIEQTCSLLAGSKGCINNYISGCYPSETAGMTIQTLENVLSYICSPEGKDALLTESKCIANVDFERPMHPCPSFMEVDLAIMQPQNNPQAVCTTIENFSVCVRERVRVECSDKAVNFVRNLVSRLTIPIKNMMGCSSQARLVRDLVTLIARRK
ncbi:uncharacterized protein LOC112553284 [Pomacea canaliculata]|uniref:uncharacterized protein LOC112553284 n=1 Tax=Pomacea canaliculata TaxID=400727 RepID=UPI000D72CCCA|nr:uncharacterized protein LOC112553284 [Pomacea canaliculata]